MLGVAVTLNEVSVMVMVLESATMVPLVERVLSCTLKVSGPSVKASVAISKLKLPLLSVMLTEPPFDTALAGELKSALLIVPVSPSMVQYKVPDPKLSVAILSVVVLIVVSFTVTGSAVISYAMLKVVKIELTIPDNSLSKKA